MICNSFWIKVLELKHQVGHTQTITYIHLKMIIEPHWEPSQAYMAFIFFVITHKKQRSTMLEVISNEIDRQSKQLKKIAESSVSFSEFKVTSGLIYHLLSGFRCGRESEFMSP